MQHHEIFSDYIFSFDNNFLLVTYSEKSFDFISTRGSYNEINKTLNAKIPIYDFDKINDYGYSNDISISIENNNQTIIYIEDNTQTVKYSFPLSFKSNAETNLVDRIQSAFKHLKKFYSKPKSNDAF